jgi:hypothetical protein
MILDEIASQRIVNQHIGKTNYLTAKEVVASMGAMQAQDFTMSLWAVGIRLPHSNLQSILQAFNNGEILRTHLLRPTWHMVSSDDISWILELTAPHVKAITKNRDLSLGIDETLFKKSNVLFEKALEGGKHLTVDELKTVFVEANIDTDDNRFYHFTMRAELDGIICSGVVKNKKQTYALLAERVSMRKNHTKDDALAILAERYFTSHGPACLKDFVWWSGLSIGNARQGLESVKHNFNSESVDGETYWFKNMEDGKPNDNPSIHFMPAFDEIIISYRNRNAVLLPVNQPKAFSSNGIFHPVVIINGHGHGTWKRTIKKDTVLIEPQLFTSIYKKHESSLLTAANEYGRFMQLKTTLNVK